MTRIAHKKHAALATALAGRAGAVTLTAAVLVATTPVVALAEEERSGIQLLLPTMAEFVPACIAFVIIWVIMAKVAWPKVLKILDEREAQIQGDLDGAAQARADAEAKAQALDAKIADANREAADIVAKAKREAADERAAVMAKAQADAANLIARAHETIEHDRHKAAAELSGQVVDLSADIAAKVIGDELTSEQQRRLATVRRMLSAVSTTGAASAAPARGGE